MHAYSQNAVSSPFENTRHSCGRWNLDLQDVPGHRLLQDDLLIRT